MRRFLSAFKKRQPRRVPWIDDLKRMARGRELRLLFDVGANNGLTTSLFVENFPDASVCAFEPIPEVADVARTRHASNPRVKVECLALDEVSGKRVFHVNSFSETSSFLHSNEDLKERAYLNTCREIEVTVSSMDDYCDTRNITSIDLLKLDVQGCELPVLKGSTQMLRKVGAVFAEVLFVKYYEGQCSFSQVDDLLRQHGFWLYRFYDPAHADDGRLLQSNGLWLNEAFFPQTGRPLDGWEKQLNSRVSGAAQPAR
ncbi:FkbM family methyltransferase [Roseimicrobium gellanilyticum]|uniref:FkbM family methyltransferase n=1 Tax=Roseimicrobium gellanilyticum TaxID=748857 RepID=A0A366HV22_9BACT|nr:FkbM family methyltransferase [Roseimicrobium gellanilyticum]RBP48126.1 FkbM family methyltransferase [Roseimicrobium gellanilyticum]